MEVVGMLHCHSTHSYDAKLSLRELKELFQKHGVQFVCMTEHADDLTKERTAAFVRECDALSDDTFRFIPGFEVPYRKETHVLMIGMREFFGSYAPDSDALRVWTRRAPFVVLAHPVRNRFKVDEGLLGQLHGLEVWNQQYDGKRVPRVRSLKLFQRLKKKRRELVATGGIDFHRSEHMGAPLTHLDVDALTEDAILEKLKLGAFTIVGTHALMYGSCPNSAELITKHRCESHFSVSIIALGKTVNWILAIVGISLPKSLKERIRKKL